MFLVHFEGNNIYVIFQDLSEESRDIAAAISRKLNEKKDMPPSLHNRIRDFFRDNAALSDNLARQKAYVSTLRTYIDIVSQKHAKTVYYLNLYILPKDIVLQNASEDKESIEKIEKLSLRIFQLYNEQVEKKDIEFQALKAFKGKSFLDLELTFYLNELQRLHDHLLNYTRTLHDKIICSDKSVGIPVESLNQVEGNPLKRYQFVKVAHQSDLIVFVYSLIRFLQQERISTFKDHRLYPKLQAITSRIYNFLHKISTTRHLRYQQLSTGNLERFFSRFQNSPEIQKNRRIFEILKNIFANQLKDGVFLSKSINMTKMFEKMVAKRLSATYGDALYRGEESEGKIRGKEPDAKQLYEINFLLKEGDKPLIRQYPDYLIKEEDVYHVVDAKYKLYDSLMKDRSAFWQILIYAKLFNKSVTDLEKINKVVLFAEKSNIDLNDDLGSLEIDLKEIDIDRYSKSLNENVFDTEVRLISVKLFRAT